MNRAKKKTEDKHAAEAKPVSSGAAKNSGQTISGHSDSDGGSRQGNIGHESSAETGRGDRQV